MKEMKEMKESRSPLAEGLGALLRHRRLAGLLWLASLVALLPVLPSLVRFTARWDDGPFRESILKGWDGWAVLSWFAFNRGEASTFGAAALVSVGLGAVLYLVLVPGLLRTLVADVKRPVLRRVVAESAALLRPNLWGFSRYVLTLALWEGLLVALPLAAIGKLEGDEAPPNGPLATLALAWALAAGSIVFLNVSLRWAMARVALARGDSPTARGAFRVAKKRLQGRRIRAIGIALSWLLVGAVLQAGFTRAGVFLNPATGKGILGLVLFRQVGFLLLAASRVGYWASLLAFERRRRPLPATAPAATEVAPVPLAAAETAETAEKVATVAPAAALAAQPPAWQTAPVVPSSEIALTEPESPRGEDEAPKPTTPSPLMLLALGVLGVLGMLFVGGPVPALAEVISGPALQGAVTVSIDDNALTARVTAERVANNGCLVTGNLAVQLWAATAPPVLGQVPSGDKLFEIGVLPLLPGNYYAAWDSKSLPFTPPSSVAARDVVVVLAEQGSDGIYRVRDSRDTGWRFFTTTALLSKGRVTTTVRYRDPYGPGGLDQANPLPARPRYVDDEFGFFWFTDPANAEVYVKALGENDPSWIQLFAGGTTDFEYSVSWQGCGQVVSFTKPAYLTDGYANGQGIDKTKCGGTCPSIAGTNWRMSLSNSCGQQTDWKYLQVTQNGCDFSFTTAGTSGLVVTGTLSGNAGSFTFVQSPPCTGSGTGTLTVDGGTITGVFSGTVPTNVKSCCPAGPLSGNFTITR